MKNSEFNNSKRAASVGMFYFWTFAIFIILSVLFSCSTPELEKQTAPDLYPTEKCFLTWEGDGQLLIIDKNHTISDTLVKSSLNGSSDINLIIRGYYEIKVIKSTHTLISLTNARKEIVSFNGATNGLTLQFFNR